MLRAREAAELEKRQQEQKARKQEQTIIEGVRRQKLRSAKPAMAAAKAPPPRPQEEIDRELYLPLLPWEVVEDL